MTCPQRNPKLVFAVLLLSALQTLCLSGRAAAADNLIYGDVHAFQYDAWNRLVQVNEAIANQGFTEPGPGADENPVAAQERWWPGRMLKHYKYDGLGRLIETQSPYPDVETAMGRLRTERFYYDGVRRIQEVVTDPLLMLGLAAESGNPELQQAVANAAPAGEVAADPQTATLESEEVQMLGGEWLPATVTTLHREYVWGPGDRGVGGVDELLVQFDAARKAWWMLVDGGGDVVAMCEKIGSGGSAYAAVSAQWTYDAYGAVIDEDVFDAAAPVNRAGHKGLFADRLDVGVVDEWGHENCRLIPGAELAFYNRNRTYSPYLGRFLQSDPNATGVAISPTPTFQGDGAASGLSAFDFELLYGNGHNTYQYLGSSTWTRDDPTGLSWGDGLDMLAGAGQFALGATDPGGLIGSMYSALIEQYSANLDYDVDWAVDWTQGDDWHTRTSNQWVTIALVLATTEHFGIEIDEHDEGPSGPAMGSAAKRVAAGLAKAGGRIKGLVRKNIAEMILKKANEIVPSDRGISLTHAGRAFEKHKGVVQVLGSGIKYGGNAATKNKIGQQFVEKMMKTGRAGKKSKTQVVFMDPNMRGIDVKASFDNNGNIFKVDFLGPRQ